MVRLALLLVAIVLTGCGGGDEAGDGRTVVAAFYPLAWAAEEIAGDDFDVVNLTPAGAEPHDLELSARDVERVRDADVVFYLGQGFMPALEDALADHAHAVDLLRGDGRDPHVWLDPVRLAAIAKTMAAELGDEARANDLVESLEQLDSELDHGLLNCERREIVTSHAAFGHLAAAYQLRQIALTGISPEGEPSPRALEELVAEVEDSGATTVFFETLVSPELAETVAREAGARTAALDPLEGLTDDDLAAGTDYLSVMRDNLATLRTALGCR